MESSLHRQLKDWYAGPGDKLEANVGTFRIDIAGPQRLVEIQQAGLGALRSKISRLLEQSPRVVVVKPIIARKHIVVRSRTDQLVRRRRSPKRGTALDLFGELVHFVTVFPHPRLTLEVALVEVEEWRYPPRRRWSRRGYEVRDRKLLEVHDRLRLCTADDLLHLLPAPLPANFDTQQLATRLNVPRWFAQQIAYCLRHCGAVQTNGRKRNAWQYVAKSRITPDIRRLRCA